MYCHEKAGAWTTAAGTPCRQTVSADPGVIGCVHHRGDPEAVKRMQAKGGLVSQNVIRVKKGALADSEPNLALATLAEIDAEIAKALEQLRRGQLGERKAEVLIASLQKMRATKVEEAPKQQALNVSIGSYTWRYPLTYCPRCGFEQTRKPNGTDFAPQTDVDNSAPAELADLDDDVVPYSRFKNMARRRTA